MKELYKRTHGSTDPGEGWRIILFRERALHIYIYINAYIIICVYKYVHICMHLLIEVSHWLRSQAIEFQVSGCFDFKVSGQELEVWMS